MKVQLNKPKPPRPRCNAIVQPGEYTIDRWDGKQCEETNLIHLLMRCEKCGYFFCLAKHWQMHVKKSECWNG